MAKTVQLKPSTALVVITILEMQQTQSIGEARKILNVVNAISNVHRLEEYEKKRLAYNTWHDSCVRKLRENDPEILPGETAEAQLPMSRVFKNFYDKLDREEPEGPCCAEESAWKFAFDKLNKMQLDGVGRRVLVDFANSIGIDE